MEPIAYDQLRELERDHWWFRGRRRVYLGLLEEHYAGGARPRRALDLGSGFGGFLRGLTALADRVVAADLDRGALSVSGARTGAATLVAGAERLPFRDGSFDLLCLFDVLEHTADDRAVLRECRRVLAPGGTIFVSVPAYPALFSNNDRVAHHRRRYTRRSLRSAFEDAGLTLERNTHANALLLPLIAPAVLTLKAYEALFERPGESQRTNLSWTLPRPAHELLYRAFAAELPLSRRFDLPAGHSIAAIARNR